MPLPMPRWVISSASHMTSAVPAVQVSTISAATPNVTSRGSGPGPGTMSNPSRPLLPLVQGEHEAGRLHDREADVT